MMKVKVFKPAPKKADLYILKAYNRHMIKQDFCTFAKEAEYNDTS